MSRVWTVARRELKALFDQPTAYVLLIVFLAVNAFLFFRQAYVSGSASLRPMLDLLPWMLLFFVPAVTMRSIAEDTRNGVLEVVLAQPLTEFELLLGKYLGSTLFLLIALACTLPIPLGLGLGADLQLGPIAAQYVGTACLAAGLAGIGVWASSVARNQITAFIVAVGAMFVLVLVGLNPLLVGLPPALGTVAARLGVLSHFDSMGRGVIDLRDVIYFLSLAGIFLALAYGAIAGRKLARGGAGARRLRGGVVLLTAILVAVNLFGSYIHGRLDLTPGRAYTLSDATEQIVGKLDDIVTVKLFASDELPTEVALLKRDIDDLLHDLRAAGRGRVRIVEQNPAKNNDARTEAQSLGIQSVQFNVIGRSELNVKDGFLGLAVQYGGKTEAIPFISRTDDLEYRLVSAIRTLSRTKRLAIGMINETRVPGTNFGALEQQLRKSYDVRPTVLTDSTELSPDLDLLVLIGNRDSVKPALLERLGRFFDRGGSALVMTDGMDPSMKAPVANPRPVAWNPLLKRFGVAIRSDMVYDVLSSDIIPVASARYGQALQRYPFFVRTTGNPRAVVSREVSNAMFSWASSIDTAVAMPPGRRRIVTPLFTTTRGGGVTTGETTLDPTRDWPQTDLGPQLLAVQVHLQTAQGAGDHQPRLIAIGDADLVSDRFVQHAPENLAAVMNAVDWLAQDEALIGIRLKERRAPRLVFPTTIARETVKYGNMIGVPVLVALAGLLRLARRRRKARQAYRPITETA